MSTDMPKLQHATSTAPGERQAPSARTYLLALGGFVLLLAVLIAALYLPSRAAHSDAQTWKGATAAANYINDYVNSHQTIPADMHAAGVRAADTHNVSYHKDSDKTYTFCVNYQKAGEVTSDAAYTEDGSFGGDLLAPIDRAFSGDTGTPYDENSNPDTNYLYVPGTHKAGKQCQTIKPQFVSQQRKEQPATPLSQAANGHTLVCGTEVNRYSANGPILKFNTINVGLNNSPTLQPVTMVSVNASQIPGDAGSMDVMYGPGSKIFDQHCKVLAVADLKIGDTVGVYYVYNDQTGSVAVFLKQ
jgi:hypothetical protein